MIPPIPTPAITLQPVRPEDGPVLFEIYAGTRADELDAWGWDETMRETFLRMQFEAQRRSYAAQFPDADHTLVRVGGVVAGRLLVAREAEEIRIVDVALLPEYRGRGIGTSLVRRILDEGRESARPVRLQVLSTNPARHLYERLGFTRRGGDDLYHRMEWKVAA